jgi:hypothetical protein
MLKSFVIGASVAVAMIAATSGAQAADAQKSYYQVGAAATDLGGNTYGALNLGIGHSFTQHFAVELDGDVGVTNKTISGVKTKIDYAAGIYAVGIFPLSTTTDFIVRGGDLQAQLKGSYAGYSATASANGPAIGVGFRFFPNAGVNGVRGDVTHYDFGNKGKGEVYQVAYIRKF